MTMMMMTMTTMIIINALINKMIVFYFATKVVSSVDDCFCVTSCFKSSSNISSVIVYIMIYNADYIHFVI